MLQGREPGTMKRSRKEVGWCAGSEVEQGGRVGGLMATAPLELESAEAPRRFYLEGLL